jgi:hypothetical protein
LIVKQPASIVLIVVEGNYFASLGMSTPGFDLYGIDEATLVWFGRLPPEGAVSRHQIAAVDASYEVKS